MKNNIYEIIYTDGHHEYVKYLQMDAYCGDKKVIKILNMIHYCGHIMSDEDYKEFVLPNKIHFEILECDKIEVFEVR